MGAPAQKTRRHETIEQLDSAAPVHARNAVSREVSGLLKDFTMLRSSTALTAIFAVLGGRVSIELSHVQVDTTFGTTMACLRVMSKLLKATRITPSGRERLPLTLHTCYQRPPMMIPSGVLSHLMAC